MPMVNQVEVHPQSSKNEMLNYCIENNIQLIAWSPIMRGKLFTNELMLNLSEKYQKLLLREGFIPSSETLL